MSLFSRKTTFKDCGFFKGLVDFHSHILPGVDDGIKVMEHSLKILDYFELQGVTTIWCTPHVYEDLPNETNHLKERFEQLKNAYNGSIQLKLAAEYMLDHEFASRLDNNDLLPLGDDQDHLLVETSFFSGPENLGALFERILSNGFYPVLAHPERYIYMNRSDYKKWKSKNIKFQLNYTSLAGFYGKEAQTKAAWMLENGMYNVCGSDIHNFRYVSEEKNLIGNMPIKSKWADSLSKLRYI